jgi:AraC-like DNA-binding protein
MQKPLDQFPVIRTRDAEEMRAVLTGIYGGRNVAFPEGTEGFAAHANHVQLRHIALSYCTHGAAIQFHFPEANFVRQHFCIRGAGTITTSQGSTEFNTERSCVTPTGTDAQLDLGSSIELIALRIPEKVLAEKAAALLGTRAFPRIEFERTPDLKSPRGKHLRNLVWFLTQTLDETSFRVPPAAIEEFEQTIAVAFLYCNSNSLGEQLEQDSTAVAPWQVRRAEEYIEAHWSAPLTVELLAATIGASVRSIFKTFSDYRGYTPMDFLRNVRLKHAREMLLRPTADTSVTAVGFSCGFLNLGHFAKHYQAMFGELPSETLARAKGGGASSATGMSKSLN